MEDYSLNQQAVLCFWDRQAKIGGLFAELVVG